MVDSQKAPAVLTGSDFRGMVTAGTQCIEQYVEAINALNVFPVPDGDTGINMLLTLRTKENPDVHGQGQETIAEASDAIAHSALLGARGNSGVIFSQFLRGVATSLRACTQGDTSVIAESLANGAAAAYKAVSQPVEGTMLTVLRAAGEGAKNAGEVPIQEMWRHALYEAKESLSHTPEMLPVLNEAGVVDAGGQGVVAFMTGALAFLEGHKEIRMDIALPAKSSKNAGSLQATAVDHAYLNQTEEEAYGYCIQLLINGQNMNVDDIREMVSGLGNSTVVIGDQTIVKVHTHAIEPEPVLDLVHSLGVVDQLKIENMDSMHEEFMELHGYVQESKAMGLVVVASGTGLQQVFRDLGASSVIAGGQTMNPSTQEIVQAIIEAQARHVFILPNNPNITMAAQQACELSGKTSTVIPARTVPQGIAALLAYNPDLDVESNQEAMEAALLTIRSGEITYATRDALINNIRIKEGQAIGLLDGVLIVAAPNANDALLALLESTNIQDGELITIYEGASSSHDSTKQVITKINDIWPQVEVELIEGGQPYYEYLISIE